MEQIVSMYPALIMGEEVSLQSTELKEGVRLFELVTTTLRHGPHKLGRHSFTVEVEPMQYTDAGLKVYALQDGESFYIRSGACAESGWAIWHPRMKAEEWARRRISDVQVTVRPYHCLMHKSDPNLLPPGTNSDTIRIGGFRVRLEGTSHSGGIRQYLSGSEYQKTRPAVAFKGEIELLSVEADEIAK